MAFLLQLDELIYSNMLDKGSRHIMDNLQQCTTETFCTDGDFCAGYFRLMPWRLILNVVCLLLFMFEYYHSQCSRQDDGSWVSQTLRMPTTFYYNPLCVILECHHTGQVLWQMPDNAELPQ